MACRSLSSPKNCVESTRFAPEPSAPSAVAWAWGWPVVVVDGERVPCQC